MHVIHHHHHHHRILIKWLLGASWSPHIVPSWAAEPQVHWGQSEAGEDCCRGDIDEYDLNGGDVGDDNGGDVDGDVGDDDDDAEQR